MKKSHRPVTRVKNPEPKMGSSDWVKLSGIEKIEKITIYEI